MYHYLEDKTFVMKMKAECCNIINQLVQLINKENTMQVKACLVGSGAKNLITQNGEERVDLDFNLTVIECYKFTINNGGEVKEYIKKMFNKVLSKNGWDDCCDSTSVLTTKERYFKKGNRTHFKIDLCITKEDSYGFHRLIHNKTGVTWMDTYNWTLVPSSKDIFVKAHTLKKNGHWQELRNTYLKKKNLYLKRQDNNHPSFNVYIESINEVYKMYCKTTCLLSCLLS